MLSRRGASSSTDEGPAPVDVRFDRVGLRYDGGAMALSDISFELAPGSLQFVTGPSGAGKSSLLSLIYLAQRPSSGRISLFGRDVDAMSRNELPELRRKIGVVFQDFRLLDHLSALDNVALPLRIARRPEGEVRANVRELLAWVGLGDQIDAKPPTLSGGQKQRVAIARAVVTRPQLLVADEPTGNVDDRMAVRLLHLFEELNRIGTTVVIATHNDNLVARFRYPALRLEAGALSAPQAQAPA